MPIVKYEQLNTKRRVSKVLIVEYEVLHMKRKVDKMPSLNIKYPCPLPSSLSSTFICSLGLLPPIQTFSSLKSLL